MSRKKMKIRSYRRALLVAGLCLIGAFGQLPKADAGEMSRTDELLMNTFLGIVELPHNVGQAIYSLIKPVSEVIEKI